MRANILIFLSIFFTAAFSQAQLLRCAKVDSYSSPCPTMTTRAGLVYGGERYKSVSGICGDGSPKTITVQYCSSKSLLASRLSHACVMARQCGLVSDPRPQPLPIEPIRVSFPPKLPPEEPLPPVIPPEEPSPIVPPIKLPPEEPSPIVPPIKLPPEVPSPIVPPIKLPPEVPPPSLPVTPSAPPISIPVKSEFKGQLVLMKTNLNLVDVQWMNSATIGDYCGTGTNYIHYAKLDKSLPENAAFFATYSSAARQSMNVILVCRAPRKETSAVVVDSFGDSINTVYYTYPDGCYVSMSSVAAPPPRCYLK